MDEQDYRQMSGRTAEAVDPKVFIVSDTHFNHVNIIAFCSRPFADVDEMNESLILRWNNCVRPQDTVIHLGDVGFRYETLFDIVPRLHGRKLLIRGNHDWNSDRMERVGFRCLTTYKNEVYREPIGGRMLIMAHRPRDIPTWEPDNTSTWSNPNVVLCGHEHSNAPQFIKWVRAKGDVARPIMALNMSVEHWNYTPTPVEKVIEVYDRYLKAHI